MILIMLKVQVRPDRRDVWLERIAAYAKAVRDEPGNNSFDCYESIDAPNEFAVMEGSFKGGAGAPTSRPSHFKDFLVWFPTVIGKAPLIINTAVHSDFAPMGEFG